MALRTTREVIDAHNNPDQRARDVEAAADAGMPYTAYIDLEYDPEKDRELGADDVRRSAMEVVQDDQGITTECIPAAGIFPTPWADIEGDPAKEFTLKEMSLNTYRSVAYAPQVAAAARKAERRLRWQRAGTFQDTHDTPPGSALTPFAEGIAHWDKIEGVDIPIESLTTRFSETSKKDYRATILQYEKDAFREEVRTPGAEPPMATFDTSPRPIQLKKRMLAIPFTYEHLREVEFIDKALEHVEEIAVERQNVKGDECLKAMLHGSPDDADLDLGGTILRLQELDEDATDTMTPRAWYNLQKKFKRMNQLTSAIGYDDDMTGLQLAKVAGSNVMLVTLNERENAIESGSGGSFSVMNQTSQGTEIGWHDYLRNRIKDSANAMFNCIIVFNKARATEYVSQMNTDIVETTRDMLKQVEFIICSEIWGWISYQPKSAIYIIPMGNPASGALTVVE